jgi:hypothetical protein
MNLICDPTISNTYRWSVWWAGDGVCLSYNTIPTSLSFGK